MRTAPVSVDIFCPTRILHNGYKETLAKLESDGKANCRDRFVTLEVEEIDVMLKT